MKKILLPLLVLSSTCFGIDRDLKHNLKLGAICLAGAYASYKTAQHAFNNPTEDSAGLFVAGSISTTVLGIGAVYHLGYKTLEKLIKSNQE
jgi:hypothetical protein